MFDPEKQKRLQRKAKDDETVARLMRDLGYPKPEVIAILKRGNPRRRVNNSQKKLPK